VSFSGHDTGNADFTNARARAESKVADAQRHPPQDVETPRWVSGGMVLKVVGLALIALLLVGWVLTLVNS
jgi:hypothetical protein